MNFSSRINTKKLIIGGIAIASLALLAYAMQRPTRKRKKKNKTSKRKTKDNIIKTFNTKPINVHLVMETMDGFNAHVAADRENIQKIGLKYGSRIMAINNKTVTNLPYKQILTILSTENIPITLNFMKIPELYKQWKKALQLKEEASEQYKKGLIEQAIDTLSNAINLHPTNKVFYSNRILMYLKLKQYNNALNDCEIIKQLDPLSLYVKGHYLRGLTLLNVNKYKNAMYAFQQVLKLKPTFKKATDRFNECLEKDQGMDISKYELIDIKTKYLIDGYVRSMKLIDKQMKDLIGPHEINKICAVFFYVKILHVGFE